ncbi:ribonucleases P/MRP protein subunit POP1 [Paramormyrops kingsleyae]|uniref:ribonucleases P/MRP protein subunit POP1 n=1 Tax=Paramormyrops kingsleyae TaxID=1676925 RepID=UPI003B96D8B7
MSGAKHRMRSKKMRNQPSSITYTSTGRDTSQGPWRNGEETPLTGQKHEHSGHARGHGPPPSDAGGQYTDWVRGRPAGGASPALPRFITASTFAMARAAEVSAMMKAVTKTTGSCHVFGGLPKHMRRRAMSHNTKRLPRRLREGAQKMMEKSRQAGHKEKKDLSKRKSRKARRRHGNLLLEFNRRQRKNVWLETHIWHAKRFHMVKRWGYCLGDRPTYKCYRACYRAMSQHCLLQDLSYYCCLELQGPEEALLAALSRLTSKETGPTFAAAHFLSGRRQGSAVLYRADGYPAAPLGPVLFLWRPKSGASSHRQLWIWSHPTLKQDLLPELQAVCQCSEPLTPPVPVPVAPPAPDPDPAQTPEVPDGKQPRGKARKRVGGHREAGVPAKKILGDGTRPGSAATCWRCDSTGVVMSDLTMELVRYRLIGPLSHMILTDTLTPAAACQASDGTEASFWWPAHCREESHMSLHQRQTEAFQLLRGLPSTADIPAGSVLGLAVDDPRLTLPSRRCRSTPDGCSLPGDAEGGDQEEEQKAVMLQGLPEQCSQSSLWDRSVRDNVTDNKLSEQELNQMKSELLVPGSRLQATPQHGRIPVLLVQQPGKQTGTEMGSWGAGWDLLLPKGWGMAFWVPLVYRGVRVGGQQEALKHSQNKGAPHFPHDFPDCPAGARFQSEQEAQFCETYKRRPPAKRPNFIKHGSLAPFLCPWQQLAEEWETIAGEGGGGAPSLPPSEVPDPQPQDLTSPADDALRLERGFTVLRDRKALQQLSAWCRPTSSRGQRSRRPGRPRQAERPIQPFAASLSALQHRSLVWARLSLLRKGRPALHAAICMPAAEDFVLLCRDPACCGPQEPQHVDHFKSRMKRRKKAKMDSNSSKKLGKNPGLAVDQDTGSAPGLTLGLWPSPLPSVTSHCSRVTLGWTTQGDFSLAAGCGEALGFVSLTGLLHMLVGQPEDLRGLVLLRNPASLQYRFAKITIEA